MREASKWRARGASRLTGVTAFWAAGGTELLDAVGGSIERWGRERSTGMVLARALAWHTWVWDPWFFTWGVALAITLWCKNHRC